MKGSIGSGFCEKDCLTFGDDVLNQGTQGFWIDRSKILEALALELRSLIELVKS